MTLRTEGVLQADCVRVFALKYPDYQELLFAIPNGGFRTGRNALNLKKQGVKPGVPDLMLAVPAYAWHGLFVELKRTEKLSPTDLQVQMMLRLKDQGYMCAVAYSTETFLQVCFEYLGY